MLWGKFVAQLGYGQRGRVTSSQCNSVAHCPVPSNASSLMISVKNFYSRRKEYNQHEPSQFHSRDATDGICTCIRMFGIAVNKAQQLSLAMEILAKGKKKKRKSV